MERASNDDWQKAMRDGLWTAACTTATTRHGKGARSQCGVAHMPSAKPTVSCFPASFTLPLPRSAIGLAPRWPFTAGTLPTRLEQKQNQKAVVPIFTERVGLAPRARDLGILHRLRYPARLKVPAAASASWRWKRWKRKLSVMPPSSPEQPS